MTSYTGVVKAVTHREVSDAFPWVNPWNRVRMASWRNRRVYVAQLTGTAAVIGTDDYTFTIFLADRALVVDACFVIDPIGIGVDATNDNNFTLTKTGAVTMCQQSTAYSIVANEPFEITRANTVANRTLAAGNTVTMVIDGDTLGQVINHGTLVFVVCSYA